MTAPIPYYKGERDYYSRSDPRYRGHLEEINTHDRLNNRINASAGDHSYSILIHRKDIIAT